MAKRKKTGGRAAGTPNKITATTREALKLFLEAQRPEVEKAFKKLSPKEKVFAYTRLLPFITPQFASVNCHLDSMDTRDAKVIYQFVKQEIQPNADEARDYQSD